MRKKIDLRQICCVAVLTSSLGCSILGEKAMAGGSEPDPSTPIDSSVPPPTTSSSSTLQNTIPASIQQNGNNFNLSSYTSIQSLPCNANKPGCLSFSIRSSPYGIDGIVSLSIGLGVSPDDIRAEVEKIRVETEGLKNQREYEMQLMEKLATAIEEGKLVRANILATALAPLKGYKDHQEYLRVVIDTVRGH